MYTSYDEMITKKNSLLSSIIDRENMDPRFNTRSKKLVANKNENGTQQKRIHLLTQDLAELTLDQRISSKNSLQTKKELRIHKFRSIGDINETILSKSRYKQHDLLQSQCSNLRSSVNSIEGSDEPRGYANSRTHNNLRGQKSRNQAQFHKGRSKTKNLFQSQFSSSRSSVNSIEDSDEPRGYENSRTHNSKRDLRSHDQTKMDFLNQGRKDNLSLYSTLNQAQFHKGRSKTKNLLQSQFSSSRSSVNSIEDSDEPRGYENSRTHNSKRDLRSHDQTKMDFLNQGRKDNLSLYSTRNQAQFHKGRSKTQNLLQSQCSRLRSSVNSIEDSDKSREYANSRTHNNRTDLRSYDQTKMDIWNQDRKDQSRNQLQLHKGRYETHSRGNQRTQPIMYYSSHNIRRLIEKNDELLTRDLLKNKEGFGYIFCENRKVSDMPVIFLLLNRIGNLSDETSKEYFLSYTINQEFNDNVSNYLSCLLLGEYSSEELYTNLLEIEKFYYNIVQIIPNEKLNEYNEIITNTLSKLDRVGNIPDSIITKLTELINVVNIKLDCASTQLVITNLSIIPSLQDLSISPELQPNIVKGSYESPSKYLQVHFKLLKEDFVSSLRSGFQAYKESVKEKKAIRFKDIFVYDAIYCGIEIRNKNAALLFEINNKKLKKVDWKTSKRLIYGSLLLISDDNFNRFFYALLDDRENPKIDKEHFVISARIFGKFTNLVKYSPCVIIEPRVFFTPYFQVLKTLIKVDPNLFPMEKYIIEVDVESGPPSYLRKDDVYKIDEQEIAIKNDSSWENAGKFGLNKSQALALQGALTKEFVIIQGPPGTGKSYLGVKIIKTLMDNNERWKINGSPILVICYRNNAVDQILESIIKCKRKVVRLGSRSSSVVVKEFCLRSAIKSIDTNPTIKTKIDVMKAEIDKLRCEISQISLLIACIDKDTVILSLDSLKTVITDRQYQFFSFSNVYVDWLFGDVHENDGLHKSNADKFEEIICGQINLNYAELNRVQNSFCQVNLCELITEINNIILSIEKISFEYDDSRITPNEDLLDIFELLQQYEEKEIFLKKFINRMNLDVDNYIDPSSLNDTFDLADLSINDRWKLYKFWASEVSKQSKMKLEGMFLLLSEMIDALEDLIVVSDGYRLRKLNPDVVGATTTGAARLQSLLAVIKPRIVVFEEAAEVLEAHTIASLTPFCEHIIFIGDHQQLRPNPASFDSVTKYKLDISLFERMINNGMKCYTLNEQHRMRPLISSLVIPQFYPSLKNHKNVEDYPNVKGLRDNMFFVDHTFPEDQMDDSDSVRNKHEAKFVLAFADYILKQGYEKKDITILTVYGAQLFFLKECHSQYPSLKGVSIEIVDNYQGEENKIILLSLVRSNLHTIGFLSRQNRICVALTRAREGFYLIGNMTALKQKSTVWKGINETLIKNCVIGTDLPLKCSTHGTLTMVSSSKDFVPLTFGGCILKCGVKLNCGHLCELQCHGSDESHSQKFNCKKPCERKRSCGIHDCIELCGEQPCPKCDEIIKTSLPCGHNGLKICEGNFLPCESNCDKPLMCGHPCSRQCHYPAAHLPEQECTYPCGKPNKSCPAEHKCEKPCGEECGACTVMTFVNLPCGHVAHDICNVVHQTKCKVLVEKCLDCGHVAKVQCGKLTAEGMCKEELFCKKKVKKRLPCGHIKKVSCYLYENENISCDELVNKLLECGHACKDKCSTPSDKIVCSEKVLKSAKCGHMVEVACNDGPESVLCQHSCDLTNLCGHKCRGRCGELCPECPELVEGLQACGHLGKVPCSNLIENSKAENTYVNLKCETACKLRMECGHQCKGSCGKCMQGRVHEICKAPCRQLLLCGHLCSSNCNFNMHLCNKICSNSCKHQTCKHKCCDSCPKCKEKCEWKCEHLACTKLCWEECDRKPCDMPCKQLLACGHACNGLCGEPCPPICFICFPNENEGAKYILLEDCGHFMSIDEVELLKTSTIGLLLCPICQMPQIKTNYIRHHSKYWFALLLRIKGKMLNNYNKKMDLTNELKVSFKRCQELLKIKIDGFQELKRLLNDIIRSTKDVIFKNSQSKNIDSLRSLVFISHFVFELFHILKENNSTDVTLLLSKINQISSYIKLQNTDISCAQMYQLKNELLRISILCELLKLKNQTSNKNDIDEKYFEKAWELTNTMKELDENDIRKINVCVEQVSSNVKICTILAKSKFLGFFEKYYQLTLHRQNWKECEKNKHIYYDVNNSVSQIDCPTCSDNKCLFLI